jgi:aryl-phospho-beta-D-glucosidase BglC (GH1 family)
MKRFTKTWVRVGAPALVSAVTAASVVGCSQGTGTREKEEPAPVVVASVPWTAPTGAPAGSPVAEYGQLQVRGTQLVNAAGEAVQLKGVSSMWLNYESKAFAENKQGLAWLRDDWHLKVFRAAMGIEPQGGYLSSPIKAESQVRVIVRNAIELGVYVIIDWHDHHAHLNVEKSVAFFQKMAEEFGSFPNVIYEPFNEPQCVAKVDGCGPTGRLEWPQIKAYHERVVAAIREKDPDNVIILGTPTWSQDVDKAAADPLVGDNLMYTLHFYSCTHQQWLIDRAEQATVDGLPLFVTEWGATHADGGLDGQVCLDTAQAWQDWMNKRYVSSAAWKFDVCSDSSCFFKNASVSTAGSWTADMLGGHGPFVRDLVRESAPPRSLTAATPDAATPAPTALTNDSGAGPTPTAASTTTPAATNSNAQEAGVSADAATLDAAQ